MQITIETLTDAERLDFLDVRPRNGYNLLQLDTENNRGWSLHCTRSQETVNGMLPCTAVRALIDNAVVRRMILDMAPGDQITVPHGMISTAINAIEELNSPNFRAARVEDKLLVSHFAPELEEDDMEA